MSATNGKKRKGRTKFPGTVEKVIKPFSGEPEKAQISIEGADHLYRELRVPNKLTDEDGNRLKLEKGDAVEVHIESDHGKDDGDSGAHGSGESS